MKVVTGRFKGKNVILDEGLKSRPITNKILKAVFDIIGERVYDSMFLDLFSGSGMIGIEALSRGARKVTFVEIVGKAVKNIIENLDRIGVKKGNEGHLYDRVEVLNRDVFRTVKKLSSGTERYDIVFCDPPFHMGFGDRCLDVLDECAGGFLHPESLIVLRVSESERMEAKTSRIELTRTCSYGSNRLLFYKLQPREG